VDNLVQYIVFDPNFAILITQPVMRRILLIGIDRGFKAVISEVLERSQNVAGMATSAIITKDFALEPNEEKMRKAAHLTVRHLAGHLAHVACREPLRTSIGHQIRLVIASQNWNEVNMHEDLIAVSIEENLEFLCSVVKRAAAEKAVPDIEEILSPAFANRRKYRERTGQGFYDMNAYATIKYPQNLPDILRIRPPGLSAQQLRVYEEFARGVPVSAPSVRLPIQTQPDFPVQGYPLTESLVMDNGPQSEQQTHERFNQLVVELDLKINQNSTFTFARLPVQHDIRFLVRQISLLLDQSLNRDKLALLFSQKVVQLLYKTDSELGREVYVLLLDHMCNRSPAAAKEVTQWLLKAEDERRYNVNVMYSLLKAGLIKLLDLDDQLAAVIEQGRASVAEFAVKLVRHCLTDDQLSAYRGHFGITVKALTMLAQQGRISDSVFPLLEEISAQQNREREMDVQTLRERLASIFSDWVQLYQYQTYAEPSFTAFIKRLFMQSSILKNEETSFLFYRLCTEACMNEYRSTNTYTHIDAYAKLIALLIRHSDANITGPTYSPFLNQPETLTKIMTIVFLILVKEHHERKQDFDQRPYYRLFSGILLELNVYESQIPPNVYLQMLLSFSNLLHNMRPSFLPAFTFAWTSLVSHRLFLPKLLASEDLKACFLPTYDMFSAGRACSVSSPTCSSLRVPSCPKTTCAKAPMSSTLVCCVSCYCSCTIFPPFCLVIGTTFAT
jgi:CCR4-NOT transcription complex subunit 1